MKPSKIIVDQDYPGGSNEMTFLPIGEVELEYRVGHFGQLFHPDKFKLISDNDNLPLFNPAGFGRIVKDVGSNGIYFLRLRKFYTIKGFIQPDNINIEFYYSGDDSLIFEFDNTTDSDIITLKLELINDTKLFNKMYEQCNNIKSRVFMLNELFNRQELKNVETKYKINNREQILPEEPKNIFRFIKEKWEIVFEGEKVRIHNNNLKGLLYINALLENVGSSVSTIKMIPKKSDACKDDYEHDDDHVEITRTLNAPIKLSDKKTLKDIDKEIADLRDRLEEIKLDDSYFLNDGLQSEAETLKKTLKALEDYRRSVTGKSGKLRTTKTDDDLAYDAVTKAIKTAIKNIKIESETLAIHLQNSIKPSGGTSLIYKPEKEKNWISK